MHNEMFFQELVSRVRRPVSMGFKSLWNHRLRSLLTVMGIVFGVCSVIAMLAIGEGASFEAQEQIRQLGSRNIILRSVRPPDEMSATAERERILEYGLTYADMRRFRETIPGVNIIVPGRIIRRNIWNISNRVDADILGTVPWYPEMTRTRVLRGRFFSDMEMTRSENVCLLETNLAERLFPMDDPIGRTVRVGQEYYRVIGVISQRANNDINNNGNTFQSADASYRMLIPLTAARNRFGETLVNRSSGSRSRERIELHEAIIEVHDQERVVETAAVIQDLLEQYHQRMDYEVIVPLQLLRQAEQTQRIFNIVLGAIAAISLLVGGIGIMNIMLASVTERTREIGVRRALGAKQRDIVVQFLVETVLLSATGGIIGVILGIAIPFFISYFANMATIVTFWSPMLAFTISALVGVIFGIYPAFRAANMDPVDALRHE